MNLWNTYTRCSRGDNLDAMRGATIESRGKYNRLRRSAYTHTTLSIVKDVTSHKARLLVNKEIELNGALEPPVSFPWAGRPLDSGQAREKDIGWDLRYLADTLRHTADRRDHEIKTPSREWRVGRDEELIQRQRTFVQKLRMVAEAADARARAIESDID